jgi:magnesium transporter
MIAETRNVFDAISSGRVLIRPPFTSGKTETPPFASDQRIWLEDLLMRSRSLKAQRDGLEEEVRLLYERLESLETRRQTAAQMRFAAVASILLLPALIVGFFGQNFEINPWTDARWSWEISAAVLAVLAFVQFGYFKRKKWL